MVQADDADMVEQAGGMNQFETAGGSNPFKYTETQKSPQGRSKQGQKRRRQNDMEHAAREAEELIKVINDPTIASVLQKLVTMIKSL